MTSDKQPSFEASFEKLREVVAALDAGDVSIENATRLFEEGTELAKLCNRLLSEAELKISVLQRSLDETNSIPPTASLETAELGGLPLLDGNGAGGQ